MKPALSHSWERGEGSITDRSTRLTHCLLSHPAFSFCIANIVEIV